jgi:hypothetical protein
VHTNGQKKRPWELPTAARVNLATTAESTSTTFTAARTIPTITIEATLSRGSLASDIDHNSAALDIASVEHVYGCLSLIFARHFDESETTLTTCCRIKHYSR